MLDLEEIITRIQSDNKRPLLVALDGRSGTGKSTIAKAIADNTGGIVIPSDDFYSGGPGGSEKGWDTYPASEKVNQVIDWKRLRSEVLEPLLKGQGAKYQPFDFKTGSGLAENTIQLGPAPVIVLDGAYSTRPELADIIDISILVKVTDSDRRERLLVREGHNYMADWHKRWDEAEDYYFSTIRPESSFEFVLINH